MSDHLDAPGPVVLTAPDAEPGPNEFADALFPDNAATGLDSVSIGPPNGLAHLATDITDVYAFQKPDAGGEDEGEDDEIPGKSILILNVNPLALANKFETDAEYLIRIDTDGDHHEDITFSFTFSDSEDGGQTAKVRRIAGGEDDDDSVLFHHARVSLGKEAHISSRDGYRFFAGLRSDPFFFDLIGFIDDLNFVNPDFFATLNVYSIVLEVPNRALGKMPHTTSLWGRTRIKDTNGQMINDDNAARAAINTVFNHGKDKNIFSSLEPSEQSAHLNSEGISFHDSFANTLTALSGGKTAGLAGVLLPDVLNYDYTKPTNYAALNGRNLADDVINISLSLVTIGAPTGGPIQENVPPHHDYLAHFPYVGNPH